MRFLYVFSESDAEKLSSVGYQLLKADNDNSIYVFLYSRNCVFDLDNTKHVFSNVLTF